jgi:hypothetical protein
MIITEKNDLTYLPTFADILELPQIGEIRHYVQMAGDELASSNNIGRSIDIEKYRAHRKRLQKNGRRWQNSNPHLKRFQTKLRKKSLYRLLGEL